MVRYWLEYTDDGAVVRNEDDGRILLREVADALYLLKPFTLYERYFAGVMDRSEAVVKDELLHMVNSGNCIKIPPFIYGIVFYFDEGKFDVTFSNLSYTGMFLKRRDSIILDMGTVRYSMYECNIVISIIHRKTVKLLNTDNCPIRIRNRRHSESDMLVINTGHSGSVHELDIDTDTSAYYLVSENSEYRKLNNICIDNSTGEVCLVDIIRKLGTMHGYSVCFNNPVHRLDTSGVFDILHTKDRCIEIIVDSVMSMVRLYGKSDKTFLFKPKDSMNRYFIKFSSSNINGYTFTMKFLK